MYFSGSSYVAKSIKPEVRVLDEVVDDMSCLFTYKILNFNKKISLFKNVPLGIFLSSFITF
jgi:hypothetical protein